MAKSNESIVLMKTVEIMSVTGDTRPVRGVFDSGGLAVLVETKDQLPRLISCHHKPDIVAEFLFA